MQVEQAGGAAAPGRRAGGAAATLDNAGLPRIVIPSVAAPGDVYTWLLRALVAQAAAPEHGASDPDRAAAALQHGLMLIGRKWDRMDVAAALDCLPGSTQLADMSQCLRAMSIGMLRQSHSCTLQARSPTLTHHGTPVQMVRLRSTASHNSKPGCYRTNDSPLCHRSQQARSRVQWMPSS